MGLAMRLVNSFVVRQVLEPKVSIYPWRIPIPLANQDIYLYRPIPFNINIFHAGKYTNLMGIRYGYLWAIDSCPVSTLTCRPFSSFVEMMDLPPRIQSLMIPPKGWQITTVSGDWESQPKTSKSATGSFFLMRGGFQTTGCKYKPFKCFPMWKGSHVSSFFSFPKTKVTSRIAIYR